ncbi:glycosyltransferase [Patescibacteria group bacterium]|nr:glycosyltransferase [Patescibacteria group bacterium]
MKDKKILFLVQTLAKGGGERVVSELTLNFPENIQRIIVLFEEKVSYPYKGKLVSLNIPFSKKFFPKVYYLFSGFFRFKRIIKKEKPSYIISFGNAPNIFNALIGRKAIIRGDNFLSEGYKTFWGRVYKILVRLLFNRSAKIIAVSKGIKNDFIRNFGVQEEKIKVIHNPIDVDNIRKLSKELLKPEHQKIFNHPVLINIGRLGEQKGQWHLIKAFKEIKREIGDLKLVILGEGKLKSYFKKLIQQLGLENDVYILGWQKNPFKFLSKSNLFILSSHWEGLPTVILEAMTCGLPVISTDCKSGPREILAPDTNIESQTEDIERAEYGILIPTKNEEILSKAIIEMLNDKNLANNLALKSQKRVKDFNIDKIIKKWEFLTK